MAFNRPTSRLARLEEKRNIKRAALFTVGIIGIVVLVVTLGFSLLSGFFLFVSGLKPKDTTTKDDFIPPVAPTLFISIEATNSAHFAIRGSAEARATVTLSKNSTEIMTLQVPDDGYFEFKDVSLSEGTNIFSATAVDEAGNKSLSSSKEEVYYSNKQPKLEISSPNDDQEYIGKEARVEIKGQTDGGNRVSVNDRVVIVSSSGSFVHVLGLSEGETTLVIKASDTAGNVTTKEMKVRFRRE